VRTVARNTATLVAVMLIPALVVAALIAIVLHFAGCATLPQPIPFPQPIAADVAWQCVGGTGPTPAMVIVPQSQLTCSNTTTIPQGYGCGRVGFPMLPSQPSCVCQAGDESGSPIRVAQTGPPVFPKLQQLDEMAVVHELLHRRILQQTGDDDRLHKDPRWANLLPVCNAQLKKQGF
jgi:hypothetical protein